MNKDGLEIDISTALNRRLEISLRRFVNESWQPKPGSSSMSEDVKQTGIPKSEFPRALLYSLFDDGRAGLALSFKWIAANHSKSRSQHSYSFTIKGEMDL